MFRHSSVAERKILSAGCNTAVVLYNIFAGIPSRRGKTCSSYWEEAGMAINGLTDFPAISMTLVNLFMR
jgi:hypothetical protein